MVRLSSPQVKRVIIVHGWSGKPEHGWYPWLKKELVSKGFEVIVPQLPDENYPRIEKWVPALSRIIDKPDENTYLIGHSLGCQTICRYLEGLPNGIQIGGAIFVAGFFKHLNDSDYDSDDKETENHWLNRPIDFAKIRSHINKSVAIFSEDDPDIPLDNNEDFETELGSKVIILNGYKHFTGDAGITELPIVLEKLLEIATD